MPDWIALEVFVKYVLADFNPWQMLNIHWRKANNLRVIFFTWRQFTNDSPLKWVVWFQFVFPQYQLYFRIHIMAIAPYEELFPPPLFLSKHNKNTLQKQQSQ